MKILLIHRGNLTPILDDAELGVPAALSSRGTSHAGEVNALLVSHWLQQDHGHEVHWYSEREPGDHRWLLHPVGPSVDLSDYDMVLMWKIVGCKLAARSGVLERLTGQRLATWYDAGGLERLLTPVQRAKVTHIVWGTHELLEVEEYKWQGVKHAVAEHACNFLAQPSPVVTSARGVYFGRLPRPYLDAVRACSQHNPMDVFGLWAPTGDLDTYPNGKIPLRHRCTDEDVARAKAVVETDVISLYPAINIGAQHDALSGYLFGLCPSTRARPQQILSASKFWDICGLGLPVLLSSNTPEARTMRAAPLWLGEIYEPGDCDSMRDAVVRIREHVSTDGVPAFGNVDKLPAFNDERLAIRDWIQANHTYRHRATEINDALK